MYFSDEERYGISPMSGSDVSPVPGEEWKFEDEHEGAWCIKRLGVALEREMENMCLMNSSVGTKEIHENESIGRFYSKGSAGNVPMDRYVRRIMQYVMCSSSAYVVAFVYLHRILKYEPRLVMSMWNSHRLYLTAVVLATKYVEDRVYSNRFYAKLGGLASVREMNLLESEFLNVMKFDLAVSPEEYRVMESYLGLVADQA